MTFHAVVGSGRSTRTCEKPTFVSEVVMSSGARDVKMSVGIRMRSINSWKKADDTAAWRKHAMDLRKARVERAPEVDRVDGAYLSER